MTVHASTKRTLERPLEQAEIPGSMMTKFAAKAIAVMRMATGFVFLWAFLDKMFGLNYSTPSERAVINGGSPTRGFLSNVEVGPFQSMFHSMAGTWWCDFLFMAGLLGLGLALMLGVGLRIAAVGGTIMMAMMWLAEWPLAQHTAGGDPSGSTNPIVDYHVIYALAMIVAAATYAGHTWGLGKIWGHIPFVRKNHWLL
ncbi:thiosulfate dehydrogenase [quinone] large subunit [Krasilnikovia cinnamomea]|uniref:Thiosulfate dehydrogenase [quinone] large subunit n=1 Tax=Krasilnikovia cinnamomea TaxID=349313 RepID=A0A4Q7ZIB3_9ACTN|nr:DoxX family membrane protein [Krasilnikovia cinnamomea]RZU50194.1 thiosulfate dehydrogenase [quinone] large subunit [Krasilnikovia cinnamomea]